MPMARESVTEVPIPNTPRRLASALRTRRRSHSSPVTMQPTPAAATDQTAMPLPGRTKSRTQAATRRPTPARATTPVDISATSRSRSSAPP